MIVGDEWDDYRKGFFSELAEEAGDRTVVLMVDEVQDNMTSQKHWSLLLKGSKPANILVLGVGFPPLDGFPPQFDKKYPRNDEVFPMF